MATTTDTATNKALKESQQEAREVAEASAKAMKTRAKAATSMASIAAAGVEENTFLATPDLIMAAGGPSTKGWLIAEGDSWFDYPGPDIVSLLVKKGFEVESVANGGDRVEMMAFGGNQLTKFVEALQKVIRNGHIPRAILLSGGGNDIAGKEFGFLLNHVNSTRPGVNKSIAAGVIDERCRDAYLHIITKITTVCQELLGQKVKILVHGYGLAVPDGRGFFGGALFLPGPWLEPGFRDKGYRAVPDRQPHIDELINQFNAMLKGVAAQFDHVQYVDLRPLLPNKPNHKTFWANELHPTDKGFQAVADALAAKI